MDARSFFLIRYDLPMPAIAWRVHVLAARRGWGARRLAEAAGLDQKTVRNVLNGRATRVDLDTIARLSRALEVRPGALWTTDLGHADAWRATAGAAGRAAPEELADVLAGTWTERTDSGMERATRTT